MTGQYKLNGKFFYYKPLMARNYTDSYQHKFNKAFFGWQQITNVMQGKELKI